jgi:hypothetical protein
VAYLDDPYGNLPEERQEVFGQIPGTDYFDDAYEQAEAEQMYALAFGYHADEYDAMGLSADAVHQFREDFLDFMMLEWDDFPWDEWREAMGYEDN